MAVRFQSPWQQARVGVRDFSKATRGGGRYHSIVGPAPRLWQRRGGGESCYRDALSSGCGSGKMGGMTEGMDESVRYRDGGDSLGEMPLPLARGRSRGRDPLMRTRAAGLVEQEQARG